MQELGWLEFQTKPELVYTVENKIPARV